MAWTSSPSRHDRLLRKGEPGTAFARLYRLPEVLSENTALFASLQITFHNIGFERFAIDTPREELVRHLSRSIRGHEPRQRYLLLSDADPLCFVFEPLVRKGRR